MKMKLWIISDENGLWVTSKEELMFKAKEANNTYNIFEVIVDEGQQPIVDIFNNEELPWRF